MCILWLASYPGSTGREKNLGMRLILWCVCFITATENWLIPVLQGELLSLCAPSTAAVHIDKFSSVEIYIFIARAHQRKLNAPKINLHDNRS